MSAQRALRVSSADGARCYFVEHGSGSFPGQEDPLFNLTKQQLWSSSLNCCSAMKGKVKQFITRLLRREETLNHLMSMKLSRDVLLPFPQPVIELLFYLVWQQNWNRHDFWLSFFLSAFFVKLVKLEFGFQSFTAVRPLWTRFALVRDGASNALRVRSCHRSKLKSLTSHMPPFYSWESPAWNYMLTFQLALANTALQNGRHVCCVLAGARPVIYRQRHLRCWYQNNSLLTGLAPHRPGSSPEDNTCRSQSENSSDEILLQQSHHIRDPVWLHTKACDMEHAEETVLNATSSNSLSESGKILT